MDIDDLINEINDSLGAFDRASQNIQQDVLNKINLFIKDLNVRDGKIQANLENLRKINKLKPVLEKALLSPAYQKKVKEFADSFNTISKLQDTYFSSLVENYTAPAVIKEIRNIAINDTIDKLTSVSGIKNQIADLISTNIKSNSSYTALLKKTKDIITGTKDTEGILMRYAKQITTDTLNTYAANYTKIVTDDLGMDYFTWAGSLVEHSRDLCEELVHKKFIHKSEIPDILLGKINGKQIPIYNKTGLPYGMKAGTDVDNFMVNRGGWECNHLPAPVSKFRVPKDIRDKFEKKVSAK